MKKHNMILIGALICTSVLAGGSVNAQTQVHLSANIPFDFSLGKEILPAGKYSVESLNRSTGPNALVFRQIGGKKSATIFTFNMDLNRNNNGPILLFNRYGSQYFLSEIHNLSDMLGARAPRSRREKETARLWGEARVATIGVRK